MMGNRGPKEGIEVVEISKRTQDRNSSYGTDGSDPEVAFYCLRYKVKVCNVCGHRGFSNALIYCSKCSDTTVHQYCIGISPGSINDTFDWFCEYCSPSMEFEDLNSYGARTEECFEDSTVALERESEQYKNAIVYVEGEIKPLCILPPPSQHSISELNYTDSISLDYLLNDREEYEEAVSSFMECPEEIMRGVVLLASPLGKIVIQSMSCFPPPLASNLDKPVEKYGEVAYDCVAHQNLVLDDSSLEMDEKYNAGHSDENIRFFNGTVDACQKISSEDGEPQKVIVMGLPAIGTRSFSGIKRKRLTQAKFDLIPTLGPHCKRARSKRCKKSTFSWKEVDAREHTLHGSPAIEAVMQKKLCESDGVDTFININPLKMDGVHAEAFNQEFCLLNGIGDEIDAKERAPQVDHKITNQEITPINTLEFPLDVQKLSLLDNSLNREVTTSSQQSDNCYHSSNQGLGRSKVSTFSIRASSLRFAQTNFDIHHIKGGEYRITIPSYCRVCDAKVCEQVMDIEEEEMLHYNVPHLENDATKEGEVPHKNDPHSEGYDIKEVPHSNASHSKGFGSKEKEALCEHYKDYDLEEGEILDGNDEYSQDYDIEEGEIIDSHASHSKDLSFSKVTMQRQPTQTLYRKLTECHVPIEKLKIEMDDVLNEEEIVKESITYQDVCKEYDVEIQKLKKNLEDEKNKLDEVIKKNRQQMWKVVCELESTKKGLQGKIIELAKKTDEVKMAKELATKECNKKEAYKLRLKACRKCRYH